MKHVLLSSVLATVCAVGSASPATIDKLEAFPGAEGYKSEAKRS